MTGHQPLVLAIATNDTTLHVAAADAVIGHYTAAGGHSEGSAEDVEFYDETGTPLALVAGPPAVFDPEPSFAEDPIPIDDAQQLLLDRIDLVLARAQVVRDRAPVGSDLADGPARTLRVQGDLKMVLTAIAAVGVPDSAANPDPGGWFHNLMHAAFG